MYVKLFVHKGKIMLLEINTEICNYFEVIGMRTNSYRFNKDGWQSGLMR